MAEAERLLGDIDAFEVGDDARTLPYSDFPQSEIKTHHRRKSSHFRMRDLLLYPQVLARRKWKHFLPTFVHATIHNQRTSKELRKTAALDGLRGLSAFAVVLYHFFGYFVSTNLGFIPAYAPSLTFWNLPLVKYFYNGPSAVHIFFVISGYILSLRSLQQIKKHDMEGFVKTLSSSTFRRSFRLLAPITVSMFLELSALQLGLFEPARSHPRLGRYVPLRAPSVSVKFAQLVDNVKALGNLFSWADYHNGNFDDNLWTIGFEYRCSMAIFLLLLAICRIQKPWIRRTLVASLTIICRAYARWDFILFIIGMILADFDANSDNASEPHISGKHQPFWAFISIFGMFLCSYPMMEQADLALGYKHIAPLGRIIYPQFPFRLAWSVGAGCMVAGAMHSIPLRAVLESRFVQYLGRISYMLYIIHGPLLRSVGFMIVSFLWNMMTSNVEANPAAYSAGAILGLVLFLPVVFWLAELCTRLIDDNCITVARWIETQCTKHD